MAERKTYIENNDFDEAADAYVARFSALGSETVRVEECLNRIASEPVFAVKCDPSYNCAGMDGIALRAADTIGASEARPIELEEGGDFAYVNTGNPIDPRFDAVAMIEDALIAGEGRIRLKKPVREYENIRVAGESVAAGEMILPSGRAIRAADIGAILASGNDAIEVMKKPRVGIIPTGAEMVESSGEIGPGRLRETNSRVFCALTEECGGTPKRYAICPDDERELERRIALAARECDMVVVNAGSSVGTKDCVARTLERLGRVHTHGLAVRPGKPAILAEIGGKPAIGTPGYPVSAYLIFAKIARQVIEKLGGRPTAEPTTAVARLSRRVASALKSAEFVRVALGETNGRLFAAPLARGASATMSLVRADGLMRIDRDSEGVEKGEEVEIELFRPLSEIRKKVTIVGSHDVIIDAIGDIVPVSSAHVGSLGGIFALRDGACEIAPIHLLDPETGEYNAKYVEKYFGAGKCVLIKGPTRIQGIMVKKGNPKRIRAISDICRAGIAFANRQNGSGTRVLFDYLLKKAGHAPEEVSGYGREFVTHLAVSAAVRSGGFDCGLGVLSAARAFELDFEPVGEEEYDFLCLAEFFATEKCRRFVEVLRSERLRRKLIELGGYGFARLGEAVRI